MKNKLQRMTPWLVLLCAYVFAVGIVALYGAHNVNSDMSSEMVLAALLNAEGGINSPNWYYSTELRIFSHVPVFQLALRIFPDSWAAARICALAVLLALVAASLIWMGRCAGLGDAAVYAAAVLLIPVSDIHEYLFSLGGGYIPYIAMAAVLIALTLRMKRGKGVVLRMLLLFALSLWGGLTGVRMLMICGVPLLLACLLEFWTTLRHSDALNQAFRSHQAAMMLGAGISAFAMLLGYVVNAKVLSSMYHFADYGDMLLGELDLTLIAQQMQYIAVFFGLNEGLPLLSISGIADVLMLCVCVLMAGAVCILLKARREISAEQRIVVYYAVFAIALGMFLNIVTGKRDNPYAVGYYMMGVFMLVTLLYLACERMACKISALRTLSMLALSGVFMLQGVTFVRNYVNTAPSAHEEAAAWLTENGYTTGYATFWNGNVLTEASNGEIDMYVYSGWQDTELYDWLQETRHLEATPEGPVFVFVSGEEYYGKTVPAAQEAHLVWTSETYGSRVYVYDDAAEVEALQKAQR